MLVASPFVLAHSGVASSGCVYSHFSPQPFFPMANNLLAKLKGLLSGGSSSADAQGIQLLAPQQFAEQIKRRQPPQLVDVRTPDEFQSGRLSGAKLMNMQERNFEQQLQQLDPQQPVYLYCRSGRRSAMAARRLHQMGFNQVYDLQGGIAQWMSQGLPVVK